MARKARSGPKRVSRPALLRERKKIRAERERDFVRQAIHVRKYSAGETLEMGLDLISFALSFREATKNADHE